MALGWGMGFADLTNAQKADRDWKMAAALDKKADAYFADGNDAMGKFAAHAHLTLPIVQ